MVLSVVTGVATSYIVLRALDRQLEIAQATASNFNETARIFDLRFKAGVVAKTEVMQINSQAQQALAAIHVERIDAFAEFGDCGGQVVALLDLEAHPFRDFGELLVGFHVDGA